MDPTFSLNSKLDVSLYQSLNPPKRHPYHSKIKPIKFLVRKNTLPKCIQCLLNVLVLVVPSTSVRKRLDKDHPPNADPQGS